MKAWLPPALVGVALRVLSLFPLDPACQRDECNYALLASEIAAGNPLGMAGPESGRYWLWAPGYPYLLGLTEWLTGQAEWFKLVQVLAFPLLAWLGFKLAGGGREGRIAAWLLALHPTLIYFSGHLWSETVYTTLLFALLLALGWSRKGPALRGALPGLFVGLSVLMRGAATYMLPVLLLGRLWGRWRDRSAWASCGVMVLAAALTVAPWSAVASAEHGGFILSDRSLGQMMWLGNNTFEPVSFDLNLPPRFVERLGRPHCDGDLGVVEWDACEVAAGKQWIRENPGEFVRRIPLRQAQLFNPNSFLTRALRKELDLPWVVNEALAGLTVLFSFLAVLGGTLGGVGRGRGWLPVTVAGLVVYQVATVSILAGLSRYRLPLDAMWLLGAALLLARPKETLDALKSWRGLLAAALCLPMAALMGVFLVESFGFRAAPPSRLGPGGDRPDIVLISLDTLRADHLGAYGYERPTSPNLDALASRGTRFALARSPSPWTLPSHTTMLTGLLPLEHGVVDDRSRHDLPLLQQRLQDSGYATGGFVTSFFVGRRYGFDEGFDAFEDFGIRSKKKNLSETPDAERVVDQALYWADENEGESLFLFVHLYDVHYPYDPPDGFDERFDRPSAEDELGYEDYFHYLEAPLSDDAMAHQVAQYDEEIAYVDEQLGRLFRAFEGREVVFVVTADHGEEFGERGSWGHGHTLGPEQLHVPLIITGAGPAQTVQTAVGLQDIAPTLAELAGVESLGTGLSLVPALGGAPLPERAFVCDTSRFSTNRLGVYEGGERVDWDLVEDRRVLTRDPWEREPVQDLEREEELLGHAWELLGTPWSADQPVPVTHGVAIVDGERRTEGQGDFAVLPLDARVDGWSVRKPPESGAAVRYAGASNVGVDLSPEERKALEALGYIQED